MKKYRALITDYDSTLCGSSRTVPSINVIEIKNFIERGGKFAICTGRMTKSIIIEAKKIGLNGLIASFNGGEIADIESGKVLFKTQIPCNIAIPVFKFLESKNIYFQAYNEDVFIKCMAERTKKYLIFNAIVPYETGIPLSEYFSNHKLDTSKILIYDEKEKLDECEEELRNNFGNVLKIVRSTDHMMEINNLGISKAKACEELLKIWNLTKEDLITVGDSGNDLEMIEFAGLGIAVKNARQDILEKAKYIAPSNDDGAISHIIKKFCI